MRPFHSFTQGHQSFPLKNVRPRLQGKYWEQLAILDEQYIMFVSERNLDVKAKWWDKRAKTDILHISCTSSPQNHAHIFWTSKSTSLPFLSSLGKKKRRWKNVTEPMLNTSQPHQLLLTKCVRRQIHIVFSLYAWVHCNFKTRRSTYPQDTQLSFQSGWRIILSTTIDCSKPSSVFMSCSARTTL